MRNGTLCIIESMKQLRYIQYDHKDMLLLPIHTISFFRLIQQEKGVGGGSLANYDPSAMNSKSRKTNFSSNSFPTEQNREVRYAMSSPSVSIALSVGIPRDSVEVAIRERLIAGNGE